MTTSEQPSGLQKAKNVSSTIKGFSYTQVAVALVAISGAYFFVDKSSTLNRFSEAVTERLCDMLPPPKPKATPTSNEEATPTLNKESSYNPKLSSGESYNPKGGYQFDHQFVDALIQTCMSNIKEYKDI